VAWTGEKLIVAPLCNDHGLTLTCFLHVFILTQRPCYRHVSFLAADRVEPSVWVGQVRVLWYLLVVLVTVKADNSGGACLCFFVSLFLCVFVSLCLCVFVSFDCTCPDTHESTSLTFCFSSAGTTGEVEILEEGPFRNRFRPSGHHHQACYTLGVSIDVALPPFERESFFVCLFCPIYRPID